MKLYIRDSDGVMQPWWPNFLNSIPKNIRKEKFYKDHRDKILRKYGAVYNGYYLYFATEKQAAFFVLKYS